MSRYYSQNPEEPIRFDTVTGVTETPVETREFNPDQEATIAHIIAARRGMEWWEAAIL